MKAPLYARVSTEEQAREHKVSLQAQEEACRRYCAEKRYAILRLYSDPGWSGADMQRPGLQSLLDDARAGMFDMVVAHCVDRLARDQNIVGTIACLPCPSGPHPHHPFPSPA